MEYWTIFLAILTGILGIYYYFSRGLKHFEDHDVPHIKPATFLGNMAPALLRQKAVADVIRNIYNVSPNAKYVGFYDIMSPVIFIRDPDLVKSVAVKHFENFPNHRSFVDEVHDPFFGKNLFSLRDERWRDARNILSPAFTSSKMKGMFKLMSNCAKEFVDHLANVPEEKKVVELKDCFTRYTNDVIATCAFGVSINSMKDPDNEFYVLGREATTFDSVRSLKFFFIRSFPNFSRWTGIKLISDRVGNFFMDLVATAIKTRDEKNIYRPDMLQLMMDTRGKRGEGKELSIVDMTAQAFIFFFGGFDTTSTLMCFAAHEIGVNADVQEKLQAEVDGVLEANNGIVTYEAINKMEYLESIINEALRMYPVVPFLDRVCSNTYELPPTLPGAKPYVLEKGSFVWFPIYAIQRDSRYFEDPDTFNPERFMDKEKKLSNHPAFLPFGMGPRMCIGNRFALLEVKVMLFHLLAKCDLKVCPKTPIPMRLTRKGLAMVAENGFWMKIQPRNTSPEHQQLLKKCFTMHEFNEIQSDW